jgi:hypothetical protein
LLNCGEIYHLALEICRNSHTFMYSLPPILPCSGRYSGQRVQRALGPLSSWRYGLIGTWDHGLLGSWALHVNTPPRLGLLGTWALEPLGSSVLGLIGHLGSTRQTPTWALGSLGSGALGLIGTWDHGLVPRGHCDSCTLGLLRTFIIFSDLLCLNSLKK